MHRSRTECSLRIIPLFRFQSFLQTYLVLEGCYCSHIRVAEHSFQVSMPNSPLLLNHLCFGARFLQESRLTTEVFILAFWQGCVLMPWQRAGQKRGLKKWFLLI